MLQISMTKIFLFLCLCLPVMAQSTEATPESVAKDYIAASTSGDWAKAATFMDPEALVSFKNMFGEVMKMDKKNEAGRELFGLKSNAEFEQLSNEQVFVKLITLLITAVPQMKQMLSEAENTILGQVPEGSDVVHLLYRTKMKIGDGSISKVEVMSLKKSGTTWRLKLSEEMEGSFSAMAKSLLQKAQEDSATKPPVAKRPARKK